MLTALMIYLIPNIDIMLHRNENDIARYKMVKDKKKKKKKKSVNYSDRCNGKIKKFIFFVSKTKRHLKHWQPDIDLTDFQVDVSCIYRHVLTFTGVPMEANICQKSRHANKI